MADPFTLAATSMGASALGSGVSAFGAISGSKAQAGMYQYQAGIATQNAAINRQNASFSLASGESQAIISGMKTRATEGATTVKQGSSNIAIGSGSNADVIKSVGMIGAMDAATIRTNAGRTAYGYLSKANQDDEQAVMYSRAASDATQAGGIKALTSLLSGASSVSSKWLQGTQSGTFGSSSNSSSGYTGNNLSEWV